MLFMVRPIEFTFNSNKQVNRRSFLPLSPKENDLQSQI